MRNKRFKILGGILIDETLEMHERFLGKLFNKAQRKHLASFQEQGKAINDKVRLYALVGQALIEAKQSAADPFSEIEKLMTWEAFETSVVEAAKLARPEEFDHLALVTLSYPQLRRYAPQARLAGVVATVCSLVRECYPVWSVMPHEKLWAVLTNTAPLLGAGFCAGEAISLRL